VIAAPPATVPVPDEPVNLSGRKPAPSAAVAPTPSVPPASAPAKSPLASDGVTRPGSVGAESGATAATPARPTSAPAPSTFPGAPPVTASPQPLNLNLPPARMRDPGTGSRGALNLMAPPPERKSKLAEDMEKAAKPDCRKHYAHLGLLAIAKMAADAVSDPSCRW